MRKSKGKEDHSLTTEARWMRGMERINLLLLKHE